MNGMSPLQYLRVKRWHRNTDGLEIIQSQVEFHKIGSIREDEKIHVLAKLRRAVEHAGLAAHKQCLNLMFLHRQKDLSDRGLDQGFLLGLGIGRKSFHFPGSAP
jgi:hypothetical protein